MRGRFIPTLLAAATLPVSGQIWADFTVDDDTSVDKRFTIELAFDLAPRAVANFLGLATGTRNWVDAETGRTMIGKPFYNGQIIYRARHDVLSPPFESGIWLGSQSGLDTGDLFDGCGYLFQDELHGVNPGTANVVFLENRDNATGESRAHTNGSRLFITSLQNGTAFYPDLVPIGTVLQWSPPAEPGDPQQNGRTNVFNFATAITDANERPLLDLTILDIEIRRANNLPSTEFNELRPEWNLPEVGFSRPFIARENGTRYLRFSGSPDAWGIYQTSFDLQAWSGSTSFFQGPDNPMGVDLTDSIANSPKLFFRGSSIHYPTSPSADVPLADARYWLVYTNYKNGTTLSSTFLQLDFNEDGDGGTWQKLNTPVASGDLTLVEYEAESPYVNTLTISGTNSLPNYFFRIVHDINPTTGAPLANSRLQGFEWTLGGPPGFEFRVPTPNSELFSSSYWNYFPAP